MNLWVIIGVALVAAVLLVPEILGRRALLVGLMQKCAPRTDVRTNAWGIKQDGLGFELDVSQ